jgi:hypothetical protein
VQRTSLLVGVGQENSKELSFCNSEELIQNVESDVDQQRCTQHVKRFPDVPKDKPVSSLTASSCSIHKLVWSFIHSDEFFEQPWNFAFVNDGRLPNSDTCNN